MNEKEAARDWHLKSADDVYAALDTSPHGLSADEAGLRLNRYGPNRLHEAVRTPAWKRFLLQFHSALIYVLLVTAAVTALLNHWVDTGVILGVVVANAMIGFFQESKAEAAIESLKHILAPLALVWRSGKRVTVAAGELVPGDVILLQSGDKVPADVRLMQARNLHTDESALTGESVAAHKRTETLRGPVPLADRTNSAFAGTLVTSGTGSGVVVATGDQTQIGRIAGMLGEVERVDTPLIRRLASFSKTITIAIVAFCAVVFVLGILSGQPPVHMLMAVVALAVSAIPEGLPAIMTIALAIGVKRMAARNAVIRKLPAVETLGSVTVICTDKTGTLTRNEMTVTQVVTPAGRFRVSGAGYAPTGVISGEECETADASALDELIKAAALCNEAGLRHHDGQWKIDGDPTEGALLVLAQKAGLDLDELGQEWPRTDAIPFESEQCYMATLHHDHEGHAMIYLKGSPEHVLTICAGKLDAGHWESVALRMAGEGLRVLAVAQKAVPERQTVLEFKDAAGGFLFLGLLGMMDPPREEAIRSVERCREAGIQVKMITGDHLETARTVARQVGIEKSEDALSGVEIDGLSEEEFDRRASAGNVFARVSPAHKLRLVQSLQRQGEVVAMTGDGVNDAPALKQANVGVAMGITGTDVSKEAAEMVLLDDNFASIERAVEEGRTVFDNLKKTILFILPTNGGECVTLVAALLLGVTLPILPLHILWINLVTTVALAITLAFDPVDRGAMKRPPRDVREPLIDRPMLWRIVYVSLLMALGTFGLFYYEIRAGRAVESARAVAVNAIVFFEVAYLFNARRLTGSVLNRAGFFGNRVVWIGVAAVVILQAGFTYVPVMNALFQVAPLDLQMWLRVLGASLMLLLLVEGEKAAARWLAGRGRGGAPGSKDAAGP